MPSEYCKDKVTLKKTHYGYFIEVRKGYNLKFELEKYKEPVTQSKRKARTRVRAVDGLDVFVAKADYQAIN